MLAGVKDAEKLKSDTLRKVLWESAVTQRSRNMSSKRYRITFHKPGIQFEAKHAGTITGALRIAQSRFGDYQGLIACISQRESTTDGWEHLATVTEKKINVTPFEELVSTRYKLRQITDLQQAIETDKAVHQKLLDTALVTDFEKLTGAT